MKIANLLLAGAVFAGIAMMPAQVKGATDTLAKYTGYQIYDVTAYGADNSGSRASDDAIEAALKAAEAGLEQPASDKKAGAVIYFPSGSYKVESDVRVDFTAVIAAESDSTVYGENGTALQLQYGGSITVDGGTWAGKDVMSTTAVYVNHADNAVLKNIKVTGGHYGLKFRDCTAEASNISVTGCKNTGISLTVKSDVKITDSAVNKNGAGYPKAKYYGHGIGIYDNSVLEITNSDISSNVQCGLSLQKGNAVINNCTINKNGRNGVGTKNKCSVTMNGCDIYKNGYRKSENKEGMNGVIIVDGSKGNITNCKFRSNACTGLLINNGKTNVTVKKSIFKGNRYHNISIENLGSSVVKATIDSCTFNDCPRSDSVRVHVNKKSAYNLKIKGKNVYNKVKPKYTYWIGNKLTYKN